MMKAFDKDILTAAMLTSICIRLGIPENEVREKYNAAAKINNRPTLSEDIVLYKIEG